MNPAPTFFILGVFYLGFKIYNNHLEPTFDLVINSRRNVRLG